MKLLDQYFTARIDRALDDTKPLDGLTSWYVHRHSSLRKYYEEMLEIELDLRFPETEIIPDLRLRPTSERRQTNCYKNRQVIAAASAVLILLLVLPVFKFSFTPTLVSPLPTVSTQEQKIDLAELVDAISPLMEVFPAVENPFEHSSLSTLMSFEFSAKPIVQFTDSPLESTLTFLETTGIIHSMPREEQN